MPAIPAATASKAAITSSKTATYCCSDLTFNLYPSGLFPQRSVGKGARNLSRFTSQFELINQKRFALKLKRSSRKQKAAKFRVAAISFFRYSGHVPQTDAYKIVKLANGVHSVHSLVHHETFHPVVGPVAEAEALYVRQLRLVERLQHHPEDFVIWDVGFGAAANALTILRSTREIECSIHLLSFDCTLEPLEFALQHKESLGYFHGYERQLNQLLRQRHVTFGNNRQNVKWDLHLADFPAFIAQPAAQKLARPHAIMFDAFSPAKNPAMWTQPLFANLFRLLDPACPCALPTYSRSTILRVTLLIAGFFVGVGHATGEKEETTIAANTLDLIQEPLDRRWLQRAHRSTSAEPLWEPAYRQARLSPDTWDKLLQHSQFSKGC
jgi:tRNA U34 5-methylaminomethyl-2-thiouridine-forming methyltransferase MnmC